VIVKWWALALLDPLLSEKTTWLYSQIADVMMLNDVKAYLVACFHWPTPWCK